MNCRFSAWSLVLIGSICCAHAQQIQGVTGNGSSRPQLLGESTSAVGAGMPAPLDMGDESLPPTFQQIEQTQGQGSAVAVQSGATARAAAAKAALEARPTLRQVQPAGGGKIERAVFTRAPIRVNLTVERERMITLPAAALLHMPADMAAVARIEMIDRTLYVTALVPFTPIRIIAELIDSGQQIPLDLLASDETPAADSELLVSALEPSTVPHPTATGLSTAENASAQDGAVDQPMQGADMVALTRHAARQLYAPRRLAAATPGVTQVAVSLEPVSGLMRGVSVLTVPLGQWRSGNLYVTALRVTNQSAFPLELPLESLRGRWIAATAQHGRVGAAGTDTDTTALYLVCDRDFLACKD